MSPAEVPPTEAAPRSQRRFPIRVLLAKPGLDGHDRGIKVIARALRDAGMEVIYLGLRVSPDAVAAAVVQEDVDAVGISNLSGAHATLFPALARKLQEAGVDLRKVVLFGGGTIPPEDRQALLEAGYRAVFGPGASMAEIVQFLEKEVPPA
ncbi:MAG TPA: cobalamin B12-binding domain-containing protein [Planctomycetota bacterium]|jgi:methylmalonyl-CoA mutase C-terminal domain/subunit|nr:cobalamin B12-binding domain-containing protein [Planctomycetota bacterium]